MGTNLIVLVFVILHNVISVHSHCASVSACKCLKDRNRKYTADCSGLGLKDIPVFAQNVIKINLSHNRFSIFPSLRNLPTNIISLDFSYNNISRFYDKGVLKNCLKLERLYLSGNRLKLNYDTYHTGLFEGLSNLKILDLKNNTNDPSGQYYPEDTLSDLLSLEVLSIDGFENGTFGKKFQKLKYLKHLDMSGLTGKCAISFLDSQRFLYLPALEVVNVSSCGLLRIKNGTFTGTRSLKQLDISYNEDLTFRVLTNVTYDLQFTDIRVLKCNKIHHTFGTGTEIFIEDIKYLNNTRLEEIYLNFNRLEVVEYGALGYIPHTLKYISVDENRFTMGLYVLEVMQLKGVKEISGNFQYRSHNPKDIFNIPRQRSCDKSFRKSCAVIDHNDVQNVEHSLDGIRVLEKDNQFKVELNSVSLPSKLEKVHFQNSVLQYTIPEMTFSANKIKFADFSGNILNQWIGPIKHIESLNYLDLSHNYCANISDSFFQYAVNLKKLIANDNLLGFVLSNDEGQIFKHLKLLNYLDISQNRIQNLQFSVFRGTPLLQQLRVSNNLLRDWIFDIGHLLHLKFIDISNNQLSYLSVGIRKSLDELSKSRKITLDLSGNNLMCTCDTLDFLMWIKNTKIKLKRLDKYTCKSSNGTEFSFGHLDAVVSDLEIKCMSKIGLILGISFAILISVTILIAGIIFRYRWKIRYLYYITINKYRGYTHISDTDSEQNFDYDVFISYADEDRDFVKNDMISNLEKDRNIRLCIHHRDFIPGIDIAANITNAIHNSRKTVVLLSPNFLKSYWCIFEFNMARMETIYARDGRDILFLIFFKQISARDLPLMMMELIESQSYIEYPNDPQGNIVFWDKIGDAVKL